MDQSQTENALVSLLNHWATGVKIAKVDCLQ